jgi:Mycobacterium membrane protein
VPAALGVTTGHRTINGRRDSMMSILKGLWIPLLSVVVVAGFTVHRIRTFFGAEGIIVTPKVFADDPESFDPKVVNYDTAHELMAANHRSAPDDLEDATPLSQFISAQR